ncbi:MAG: hypothetical protein WD119_00850 [Pirellulaceae bacterium]
MTHFAWRGWLALIAVTTLGASLGCRQEDPITQYTIDERVPEILEDEQRMLGAIVPQGNAVWFFKVVGPADAVDTVVDPVQDAVQSVRFNRQGEPVLETPSDWKQLSGDGMTFAKYDIPTEENLLQLTVTRLANQGDWDELVVANVNRWRGQVGLRPSDEHWAGGEPFEVDAASSEGAVWADLIGEGDSGGSAQPPMMSRTSPPFAASDQATDAPAPSSPSDKPSPQAAAPAASDMEHELPEGWTPGRSGGMRLAAFEVGEGDEKVEITLIRAGGDMRGNMKMWAGQVKLAEDVEAVIETSLEDAQELTVDGQDAKRVFIEGPGEQGQAIDVVVVESDQPGEPQLFIKMMGPKAKVREQAEAFGEFLDSLKM